MHRKVEGVVLRLRVGHIDAVQKDLRLFACAAADRQVGLHTARAALTDIDTGDILQQVRYGRHRQDAYLILRHRRHQTVTAHRQVLIGMPRHAHFVQFAQPEVRRVRRLACP